MVGLTVTLQALSDRVIMMLCCCTVILLDFWLENIDLSFICLPFRISLPKPPNSFRIIATHPICDDPGATDDWGSLEGHLGSHEVTIRFFANNTWQDENRDAQMVPNDLSRQSGSEAMHIDPLGS